MAAVALRHFAHGQRPGQCQARVQRVQARLCAFGGRARGRDSLLAARSVTGPAVGAKLIRRMASGAGAVLMKGGHLDGDRVTDVLMTPAGETARSEIQVSGG